MKRKLMALVLAVLLLCLFAIPVSADLNADVRNSVAVVSTWFDNQVDDKELGWGTGFFINDQHLVTNCHVIESFLNLKAGDLNDEMVVDGIPTVGRAKIRVYFDSDVCEEAYVVGYDAQKDIAVLRLSEPTTERAPLKLKVPTEEMASQARSVYAVGYPGAAENIYIGARDSRGKNDATTTTGSISRLLVESGSGVQYVQTDCDINQGNSGGPVVTSDGYVIGVATAYYQESTATKLNYAVNIQEVIYMLNQYGISYTMASDAENDDNTDPTSNNQEVIIVQEPKPSNLPIIIISVAAVLIIAALVVVIVMMKKKDSKKQSAPVAPDAPVKKPVVRSYARVNYGMAANVSTQPILIGRGRNCALHFPDDYPGVSGSHCTVQWDAVTGDFIVTDLNSSFGTFLMSGQKMNPNQPYRMRSGDKFYLAEQINTIGLSME